MVDLLLIVQLAGKRVAFPAGDVEAVVELDGIEPVPCAPPFIAGLSALRSRVLTVIDCRASLGLPESAASERLNALIVPSSGHTYALLVDEVEDVVDAAEVVPLQAPIGAGWDQVALGMVVATDEILLLADPHQLIGGPADLAA